VAPRLDDVCAVWWGLGFFACAHVAVLSVIEAAHPHQHEPRPAIERAALPPEQDHGERDFERSTRTESTEVGVSGTAARARVSRLAPYGVPMADYGGDFSGKTPDSGARGTST
jgi:hypothetical protein